MEHMTVPSGLVVFGLMLFAFVAGMRLAWAWLVDAGKLKEQVHIINQNDVKQNIRLSQVESQITALLKNPKVKRITIKRREK